MARVNDSFELFLPEQIVSKLQTLGILMEVFASFYDKTKYPQVSVIQCLSPGASINSSAPRSYKIVGALASLNIIKDELSDLLKEDINSPSIYCSPRLSHHSDPSEEIIDIPSQPHPGFNNCTAMMPSGIGSSIQLPPDTSSTTNTDIPAARQDHDQYIQKIDRESDMIIVSKGKGSERSALSSSQTNTQSHSNLRPQNPANQNSPRSLNTSQPSSETSTTTDPGTLVPIKVDIDQFLPEQDQEIDNVFEPSNIFSPHRTRSQSTNGEIFDNGAGVLALASNTVSQTHLSRSLRSLFRSEELVGAGLAEQEDRSSGGGRATRTNPAFFQTVPGLEQPLLFIFAPLFEYIKVFKESDFSQLAATLSVHLQRLESPFHTPPNRKDSNPPQLIRMPTMTSTLSGTCSLYAASIIDLITFLVFPYTEEIATNLIDWLVDRGKELCATRFPFPLGCFKLTQQAANCTQSPERKSTLEPAITKQETPRPKLNSTSTSPNKTNTIPVSNNQEKRSSMSSPNDSGIPHLKTLDLFRKELTNTINKFNLPGVFTFLSSFDADSFTMVTQKKRLEEVRSFLHHWIREFMLTKVLEPFFEHKPPLAIFNLSPNKEPNARPLRIFVYSHDITLVPVDAVVSAVDCNLSCEGGVSAAIMKAAGKNLKPDLEHHLRLNNQLSVSDVLITRSHKLPQRCLMHAHGPILTEKAAEFEMRLEQTFINVFYATFLINSGRVQQLQKTQVPVFMLAPGSEEAPVQAQAQAAGRSVPNGSFAPSSRISNGIDVVANESAIGGATMTNQQASVGSTNAGAGGTITGSLTKMTTRARGFNGQGGNIYVQSLPERPLIQSIAIPLISSLHFHGKIDVCARILVQAILKAARNGSPEGSLLMGLQQIHLVNMDDIESKSIWSPKRSEKIRSALSYYGEGYITLAPDSPPIATFISSPFPKPLTRQPGAQPQCLVKLVKAHPCGSPFFPPEFAYTAGEVQVPVPDSSDTCSSNMPPTFPSDQKAKGKGQAQIIPSENNLFSGSVSGSGTDAAFKQKGNEKSIAQAPATVLPLRTSPEERDFPFTAIMSETTMESVAHYFPPLTPSSAPRRSPSSRLQDAEKMAPAKFGQVKLRSKQSTLSNSTPDSSSSSGPASKEHSEHSPVSISSSASNTEAERERVCKELRKLTERTEQEKEVVSFLPDISHLEPLLYLSLNEKELDSTVANDIRSTKKT